MRIGEWRWAKISKSTNDERFVEGSGFMGGNGSIGWNLVFRE